VLHVASRFASGGRCDDTKETVEPRPVVIHSEQRERASSSHPLTHTRHDELPPPPFAVPRPGLLSRGRFRGERPATRAFGGQGSRNRRGPDRRGALNLHKHKHLPQLLLRVRQAAAGLRPAFGVLLRSTKEVFLKCWKCLRLEHQQQDEYKKTCRQAGEVPFVSI
jgi:hypothetical protein